MSEIKATANFYDYGTRKLVNAIIHLNFHKSCYWD